LVKKKVANSEGYTKDSFAPGVMDQEENIQRAESFHCLHQQAGGLATQHGSSGTANMSFQY
jgi:hypothetical protein